MMRGMVPSSTRVIALIRKASASPAVYVVVSLVALYLGYALNLWRAADYRLYTDGQCAFLEAPGLLGPETLPDQLATFDRYSEGLVVGRLLANEAGGFFSRGGFTGWFTDSLTAPEGVDPNLYAAAYQYKLYLDPPPERPLQTYDRYVSHVGGQALFVGVLDAVLPFGNGTKLRVYYHVMAALTALAFVAILVWFFREFGASAAWFLTVVFSLLCYPTLYAKNLWWVIWAFYLPFVALLYFFREEERRGGVLSFRSLFLLAFGTMLTKLFFNGCEYITTTLVMAMIPACYYALKNRWSRRRFFRSSGVLVLASGLAILVFFVALASQYVLAGDTFMDGVRHIADRFLVRTHGGGDAIAEELGRRNGVPLLSLLRWYATAPAVFDLRKMGIDRVIAMKWMMVLYVAVSVAWALVLHRCREAERRTRIKALLVTVWLSALAPCSWFVVFKGHSDVHRSLASITWYMPFMFYGMALLGVSLEALIQRSRRGSRAVLT